MENLRIINQKVKNEVNEVSELEEVKRDYKEVKEELFRKNELISSLEKSIDRIGFMLSEWILDYSFKEEPDPRAAIKWGSKIPEERKDNTHGEQSFKWFYEYNRIHDLIDISMDYIMQAEAAISEEVL